MTNVAPPGRLESQAAWTASFGVQAGRVEDHDAVCGRSSPNLVWCPVSAAVGSPNLVRHGILHDLLQGAEVLANSAESAFCALTSAAALAGVGLNAWLRWWWADPAAALIIAAFAVREVIEAWQDD